MAAPAVVAAVHVVMGGAGIRPTHTTSQYGRWWRWGRRSRPQSAKFGSDTRQHAGSDDLDDGGGGDAPPSAGAFGGAAIEITSPRGGLRWDNQI